MPSEPNRPGVDGAGGRAEPEVAETAGALGATVGNAIRARRAQLGLSMRKLAQIVGCAPSYLSMIENDQRDSHAPEMLARLEWALRLRRGALLAVSSWQATPAIVKRRVAQMEGEREAARRLGAALRGTGIDALYRSGELRRLVRMIAPELDEGDEGAAARGGSARGAAGGETSLAPLANEVGSEGRDGRDARPTSFGSHSDRDSNSGESDMEPPSVALVQGLPTQVPLINKVAAGYPSEFTDLGYPARVADEYVSVPEVSDPDAFAARVVGDSMEPVYREGDIVVFSPSQAVTAGADCFVRLERDEQTTFKRVFFETDAAGGQLIRLQPLNPAYAPRVMGREEVAGLYAAVYVVRRVGGG